MNLMDQIANMAQANGGMPGMQQQGQQGGHQNPLNDIENLKVGGILRIFKLT